MNNIIALTSQYVLSKVSPIIYAIRHEDGIWEFWSKELVNEDEVKVVSLGEIIKLDPTIEEIITMEVGYYAEKIGDSKAWVIKSNN